MATVRPQIAFTFGNPAGIGPELAAKLLSNPDNIARTDLPVLADRSEVESIALAAQVTIPIADADGKNRVLVLDDGTAPKTPIETCKVSKGAGERTLRQLRSKIALVNRNEADAIVFTPLNKTSLHLAGMHEEDE